MRTINLHQSFNQIIRFIWLFVPYVRYLNLLLVVLEFPLCIARETEFYQGYIRFKMSVSNKSPHLIGDINLEFIFDDKLLHIAEHGDYPIKKEKIILGNIYGGKSKSITILFEPLTCSKATDIKCQINYTDHEGKMAAIFMVPKEISVVCPIMKTDLDINIGRLKEFIEYLPNRDSRVYEVQSGFDIKRITILAREVIEKHDVRHVSTLHTRDGNTCEIWYYGRSKVTKDDIVIKILILTESHTMELFAATYSAESLTGLLAEIGRDLKKIVESKLNSRIINVHIKDSVVQRSNLIDLCNTEGTCDVNIVIEDSVVQRTNIATVNEEVKHIQREQEELEWQRREREQRKAQETARLKKAEEKEVMTKEVEIKRMQDAHSSQNITFSSHSAQLQTSPPKKKSGKKMLISLLFILLLCGLWMGLGGSESSNTGNSLNMDDLNVVSIKNTVESDEDLTYVCVENADNEYTIPYNVTDLETYTNSIGMEFMLIPAGEFMMGSPEDEEGRKDTEGPVHKVTIENDYYLGTYEVTQEQWVAVMGDNPSWFEGDGKPVDHVSWNNAQKFVEMLNEIEGTDKYRLPSEAEWEYACRAGTTTRYSFGDSAPVLCYYAWGTVNSGDETHSVGQKMPNPWGLYDMYGNVWEWCQDKWHSDYEGATTDGSAWEDASYSDRNRVLRGGSYDTYALKCRSANRDNDVPYRLFGNVGLRIIKDV